MNLPAVSRRTRKGVPAYTADDEFLDPAGEVLVAVPGAADKRQTLLGVKLAVSYQITTYRARTERDFSRWNTGSRKAVPPNRISGSGMPQTVRCICSVMNLPPVSVTAATRPAGY